MIGTIVSIIINGAAFFMISKILPGFKVKNDQTIAMIAVAYSVLGGLLGFLTIPLVGIVGMLLAILAFIPVFGPLLAGAGFLVTIFLLTFCVSMALLMLIDKFMEDFEMDSPLTAALASLLLAILNVGIRAVLPGI